jgi:hexosaminidase
MTWRGLHLDVSRHFFDVETVRRFIDLAAFHKFNLFHWHLTDDQGWRLPVEGYPRLTEIAAWREGTLIGHDCDRATNPSDGIPHGGFYTHGDIRGIVAYAAARGIRILPEVDVPGHVQALVTAYPEFGNTGSAPGVRQCWGISDSTLNLEPATFQFLDKVVATLADLFPFPYVHFGGDEARTGEWAASPLIQERKRELALTSDRDVQSHFTSRLVALLKTHGRKLIGWDEIIENDLPDPDTAVMYWRDKENPDHALDVKALEHGHGLVLANWSKTYFDLYQMAGEGMDFEPLAICGHLPLEMVYEWNPLERIPGHLHVGVLGAQAQLWTEYIADCAHLDYMAYPRACALAQVLWTGDEREPFADFESRLATHLSRLDRLAVAYRPQLPLP